MNLKHSLFWLREPLINAVFQKKDAQAIDLIGAEIRDNELIRGSLAHRTLNLIVSFPLDTCLTKTELNGAYGSVFAGQPTLIYSLSVAAFGTFN